MPFQDIQEADDMVIFDVRLFVICIQFIIRSVLAPGIQDPGICEKLADLAAVEGDVRTGRDRPEKLFKIQFLINGL